MKKQLHQTNLKIPFFKGFISLFALSVVTIIGSNLCAQEIVQSDDENQLVVVEAENFTENIENGDGDKWQDTVSIPEDFSGEGAMGVPEIGPYAAAADAMEGSPTLVYSVDFITTGTHYFWARARRTGGGDDSFHLGIDYVIEEGGEYINFEGASGSTGEWQWVNNCQTAGGPATIEVSNAGYHDIVIYVREKFFKIDKILLTTNPDYIPWVDEGDPSGLGPDETISEDDPPISSIDKIVSGKANITIFPNPVSNSATINYTLTKASMVNVKVLNVYGQEVALLVNENQIAGQQEVVWNVGQELPNGIYFIQVNNGQYSDVSRIIKQN